MDTAIPKPTSLADMKLDPPNGPVYWIAFDFTNGGIGTWTDHAASPDEFVAKVVACHGLRIQKFTEFHEEVPGWPDVPNRSIGVGQYNRALPLMRLLLAHLSIEADKMTATPAPDAKPI